VAADRLVRRVSHWDSDRWATPVPPPGSLAFAPVPPPAGAPRRSEVMFALVQELADAGADAERRVRRTVPRLDNDLALPDQLRVMVADLITAEPDDELLDRAARLITRTAHVL
jgi:hypothetical protein